MKSFLSLLQSFSFGVTLLLVTIAMKRSLTIAIEDYSYGEKKLVLFAGPHFAGAKQVDQFFLKHRALPGFQDWIWPMDEGPEAQSQHDHSKVDLFSHLVLQADNDTLMDEMYAVIGREWNDPVKKGMFIGTEEFDRVGTVPYSHLDALAAMNRVIDTVKLTNKKEDVTVVVNYRAPRIDHWFSVFEHEVQGKDHYKGFICSRNQDTGDYEMLWETLDTAMNPLNLVKEYRRIGLKVVLLDMSGVDKQRLDISHVIACEVLKANCTNQAGWVNGIRMNSTAPPDIDRDFLSLGSYDKERLERLFRRRDCTYEKELTHDDGVEILYQDTLWKSCKEEKIHHDMVPHLQDTTSMFSAIRSQKGCNHGMSMDEMLGEDSSSFDLFFVNTWLLSALVMVLLATFCGIMVYKILLYRTRYTAVSSETSKQLDAIDRLHNASKLQPYKEAKELLDV